MIDKEIKKQIKKLKAKYEGKYFKFSYSNKIGYKYKGHYYCIELKDLTGIYCELFTEEEDKNGIKNLVFRKKWVIDFVRDLLKIEITKEEYQQAYKEFKIRDAEWLM